MVPNVNSIFIFSIVKRYMVPALICKPSALLYGLPSEKLLTRNPGASEQENIGKNRNDWKNKGFEISSNFHKMLHGHEGMFLLVEYFFDRP